jgi:type II secretory pathway component PulF
VRPSPPRRGLFRPFPATSTPRSRVVCLSSDTNPIPLAEEAMLFSPRISTSELARLCRRLATSLEAGVSLRTVWDREAKHAPGMRSRSRFRAISEAVNRGESLADAFAETGDYFPELFRDLALVGEKSGHLAESFVRLAEHYEEQIKLRRILLVASTWPAIELFLSLGVIGFLIWIMGPINSSFNRGNQKPIDPLGLGLMGTSGLAVYLTFLGMVALGLFLVYQAIRRGMVWTRPIQLFLLQLPVLGQALQNIAMARLTWAMHLTLEAGMDLRQALRTSLRATRNAHYTRHIRRVDRAIEAGNPVHEAFLETGAFTTHFLDAVRVGEDSGRLVESMGILSRQYGEQAEAALRALAVVGGFAVWMLVAAIIIVFIFRLAFFYINTLNSFLPKP